MQLIMLQSDTWNKFLGMFTLMMSGYRWMQSFGVKSITDITHLKRFALFSVIIIVLFDIPLLECQNTRRYQNQSFAENLK